MSDEIVAPFAATPATPVGLLRRPVVAAALGLCLIGRLPTAVAPLALVLVVGGGDGSLAAAGLLAAGYTAGTAVAGPALGRIADRRGAAATMVLAALVSASAFVALAVLVPEATVASFLAATVAGLATPPLEPGLRARWPLLVGPGEVPAAYTLESATQELLFVIGPALAAVLDGVDPAAPFVGCAAVVVAASLPFSRIIVAAERRAAGPTAAGSMPVAPSAGIDPDGSGPPVAGAGLGEIVVARSARRGRRRPRGTGPLAVPSLRRIYVVIVLLGAPIGALTLGLAAYAESIDRGGSAGLLLAVQAGGALVGGLTALRPTAARSLGTLLVVQALCLGPVVAAPGLLATGVLAFVAGLPLARVLARVSGEIERRAPPGTATEAFGWLITAFQVGAAAATVAGGVLADAYGPRAALAIAPITAVAAAVVAHGLRPVENSVAAP